MFYNFNKNINNKNSRKLSKKEINEKKEIKDLNNKDKRKNKNVKKYKKVSKMDNIDLKDFDFIEYYWPEYKKIENQCKTMCGKIKYSINQNENNKNWIEFYNSKKFALYNLHYVFSFF